MWYHGQAKKQQLVAIYSIEIEYMPWEKVIAKVEWLIRYYTSLVFHKIKQL